MADFDELIRFLHVAEAGSFSAAARRLGVSRQAVQRAIESLERRSGVKLFDRSSRTLRMTDAGRRLMPAAEALRVSAARADALLAEASGVPQGTLRMSAPPLLAESLLRPVIARFLAFYPKVSVEAQFDSVVRDPLHQDLDLSIRVGVPPPEGLYAAKLGRGAQVLVASPGYLRTHSEPTHPEELSEHSLIGYGPRLPVWRLRRDEEEIELSVEPRLQSNGHETVIEACREGLGLLKMPLIGLTEELAEGRLVQVMQEWRFPVPEMWAVYGHRSAQDPTLAAFLKLLQDSLSNALNPAD
ncbi:MAG: LysR family transcriptional regulator [Myxococcota bacterium]